MNAAELPPVEIPYQGERLVGVDEVGRGPLVGEVVAAAVILNPGAPISGLTDSKRLSEKKRVQLAQQIRQRAHAWAIASATAEEIDQLNIYHATLLAMRRAVLALPHTAEYALIDGNRCPDLPMPAQAVVKGDARVACISAASILAKVHRDQQMIELDVAHPEYGFAKHKGYPTREHMEALAKHGPLPQHRRSFAPVGRSLAVGMSSG